jgi:hypothetical protein
LFEGSTIGEGDAGLTTGEAGGNGDTAFGAIIGEADEDFGLTAGDDWDALLAPE